MKRHKTIILRALGIFCVGFVVYYATFFIIERQYLTSSYERYATYMSEPSTPIARHGDVTLVTYSANQPVYFANRLALTTSAHDHGIDRIMTYSPRDIDKEFYTNNAAILTQKRGAGYWLWKPYILLDAMNRVPEGTIVMYADDDCIITNDMTDLINLATIHNRVFFKNVHNNLQYVKRDAYILMNADTENVHHATQLDASTILFKNTKQNRDFIMRWMSYCRDPRVSTDAPSALGTELAGFIEHRHEQAVLSIMAKNYENNPDEQVYLTLADREHFVANHGNKSSLLPIWLYMRIITDTSAPKINHLIKPTFK